MNERKYILSDKEFVYVVLLLKWFRENVDISVLQELLDYTIPIELNNEKLFYLCSSLGYFYDRNEFKDKSQIENDSDYSQLLCELEKFEKINLSKEID